MAAITTERALTLLCDLVALPTVNPMGRPHDHDAPVERPITEYLEGLFAPLGIQTQRRLCSPIHENLLIRVPGRTDGPVALFESHMDTVPADDWADRAFTPRVEGTVVYGRGAVDDKASLAAMVLAVLDLLETQATPPRPVWLLAAGDEEYTQTGIRNFVEEAGGRMGCGVFGEPTNLLPVIQHKGVIRWDITTHGTSAHSSKPHLGRNAILDMTRVIQALADHEQILQPRHGNPLTGPPTITVTMMQGGRTRNAVPDECTIAVDFRLAPPMNPAEALTEAVDALAALDLNITHAEPQVICPPLSTSPDDPFTGQVARTCAAHLDRTVEPQGVPYGTDAAWLSTFAPAVVLGPGDIGTAHAIDECVDVREIVTCAKIYRDLMLA